MNKIIDDRRVVSSKTYRVETRQPVTGLDFGEVCHCHIDGGTINGF